MRGAGADEGGALLVRVRPSSVRNSLFAAAAALVLISLVAQAITGPAGEPLTSRYYYLSQIPNLFAEQSLANWYSGAVLLACSGLALFIAGGAEPRARRGWLAMAVVFIALSIDESIAVHEATMLPIGDVVDVGGAFTFAWVIPGIAIAIALLLVFAPFVAGLRAPTREPLLMGALLFLGSAVGLELVEGVVGDAEGTVGWSYAAVAMAQEIGELTAIALFVFALLTELAARTRAFGVELDPS